MDTRNGVPETLLEAIQFFADPDIALAFVAKLHWPDGNITCPHCKAPEPSFLSTRRIWKCRTCKKQFSAKVGTIFEDSPIPLEKWLPAMWFVVNCKNGISSYELARALGVTQKTAWFMAHRIRLSTQSGTFTKMSGEVEVDETYIGGKARFMHKDKRKLKITGRGGMGKVAVMGLLERHGEDGHSTVKAKVVPNVKRKSLTPEIKERVEAGSEIFTDSLKSYTGLEAEYVHGVINHAEKYVEGKIHTNGMENFWSLLKRSLKGTYVSVEPFHLFRYLDEQSFRFNNREMTDGQRFLRAAGGILGKRVTYAELIGAEGTV